MSFLNFASGEILYPPAEIFGAIQLDIHEKYGISEFPGLIHKNDLMFQHHLYHHPDLGEALKHYFRVGASISKEVSQIFTLAPGSRLLDFGAGYGRLTRFLPQFSPEVELVASEVKPECLKFLEEHLHVTGILHGTDAGSFPDRKFDAILALSVFTHLPEKLFQSWLGRLSNALNGGGEMIITWNDISNKASLAGQDFHYSSESEDSFFRTADRLESDAEYGLTFISRNYLEELAQSFGLHADFSHQGFTGSQSTCLLARDV